MSITTLLALISLIVFVGFVFAGMVVFGWQKSYSTYAHLWAKQIPINRFTNFWSIITVFVGLLVAPALIEGGSGNPWQFVGFAMPLYLWMVGFTPNYLSDKKQQRIHIVSAYGCAALALVWVIFICRLWWLPLLCLLISWICSYVAQTLGKSDIFWLEMAMFACTYAAVFCS